MTETPPSRRRAASTGKISRSARSASSATTRSHARRCSRSRAHFDPQPFHLDDAAAERVDVRPAGRQRLAHLRDGDADDVRGLPARAASLGSPGVEKLRWPAPVYPGDVLGCASRWSRRVLGKPARGRPGQSRTEVLNQHGQVVLSMEGFGFSGAATPGRRPPDSRDLVRRLPGPPEASARSQARQSGLARHETARPAPPYETGSRLRQERAQRST